MSDDEIAADTLNRFRACQDIEGSCRFTHKRPNRTALCADPNYRDVGSSASPIGQTCTSVRKPPRAHVVWVTYLDISSSRDNILECLITHYFGFD